jgi:spore maturation protein CgeB
MGFCPSGRLFEAAACGVPLASDAWAGLEEFFAPGSEILLIRTPDDAIRAIEADDAELSRVARAARDRVLTDHSAERRAGQLLAMLEGVLAVEA